MLTDYSKNGNIYYILAALCILCNKFCCNKITNY